MLRPSIISIILVFLQLAGKCQPLEEIEMNLNDSRNGMSNDFIWSMCQDSKGFIWIGSGNGLMRYDGYEFTAFKQKHREKNSLPSNKILSVIENDDAGLWVYTGENIVLYYPDSESVTDYSTVEVDGRDTLIPGYTGEFFYDSHRRLFLVNEAGICMFNQSKNKFVLQRIMQSHDKKATSGIGAHFWEDDHTLLLAAYLGVVRYDTETLAYEYIPQTVEFFSKKPGCFINGILKNEDGKLWITTWGYGLVIFDLQHGTIESFDLEKNIYDRGLQNILTGISKPTEGVFEGEIIICSSGYGTYRVSQQKQNHFPGFANVESSSDLRDFEIKNPLKASRFTFVDRNKITHLATVKGFISIDPNRQFFTQYENQFSGLITDIVKKNTPDHKQRYYISTCYHGGLQVYDEQLQQIKSYHYVPPDLQTTRNAHVNGLLVDRENQLWVCTLNGLHVYDELTERFRSYFHDDSDNNSILMDKVNCIIQDNEGIFWIGYYGRGFQCYDADRNQFLEAPCFKGAENRIVFNILEDEQSNIWIIYDTGCRRINSDRKTWEDYNYDNKNESGLSHNSIVCSLIDDKARLWLGTEDGLDLYLPESNTFRKYYREDGLMNDNISALAQDNLGNIWIGQAIGFSIFNPESGKFVHERNIPCHFIYCDKNGTSILGTYGGEVSFYVCDSEKIHANNVPPVPYIMSIGISGENATPRTFNVGNESFLKLNYFENYLDIDFTGVSFLDAAQNQFKCKLEGLENGWNNLGTHRSISYSSLPPGDYNFLVTCSNGDGVWSPLVASFQIQIVPPYWKTWWFYSLMVLLAVAAIIMVYRLQMKRWKEKEGVKNKLAQLKSQALMAQMNPHFIFNSLNSIQACIISNNNDAAYSYLNKFSKLVRSILQNSREPFIMLSEELEILRNYLELEQLRFKDLRFDFHLDDRVKPNGLKVPSSMMQTFVENAIIHGLSHKNGDKIVLIILRIVDDSLEFIIRDSGIGRLKAAEINKSRVKSHTSLGTSLIIDRLELINQELNTKTQLVITDLTYENGEPAGTEVKLVLPISLQEELF